MMNMRSTRLLGKATPAFGLHLVHKVLQNPIRNWQLKTPFQINLRECAKNPHAILKGAFRAAKFRLERLESCSFLVLFIIMQISLAATY